MERIKAIGFDLFNTLITADPVTVGYALERLVTSLRRSGLPLDFDAFKQAHRDAALRFVAEARADGRETHNRFWISAALDQLGFTVPPDDARISSGVDAYFSAFFQYCHPVPGSREMLEALKAQYSLGLLSNFTHAPAGRQLVDSMGLTPYFDVVLISGELGYRKPHPYVFQRLVEGLGIKEDRILYVGDDPEPDVDGAMQAGLQPIWFTYVRDNNLPRVPGVLTGRSDEPRCNAPRISSWQDFLGFMGVD